VEYPAGSKSDNDNIVASPEQRAFSVQIERSQL
jgi:hypothetical protein